MLKDTPWKKSYKPRQRIKKQRHYFADKSPSSQGYGFSSSHVWMWELDHKESWAPKNWCFWTVLLEKTLENPLDSKEIKPVHPKGNQSWIFIGRTDTKAEALILWPLMWRTDSLEKTQMLGKIEGRRRGRQRMRWLDCITEQMGRWVEASSRSWWWTAKPGVLQFMSRTKGRIQQSDWTEACFSSHMVLCHWSTLKILFSNHYLFCNQNTFLHMLIYPVY